MIKIVRNIILIVSIVGIITTTILSLCFTTAFAQSTLHSILFGCVAIIMTFAALVSAVKHKICSPGLPKLFYFLLTCVLTFISMCASYGALEFGRQSSIVESQENILLDSQMQLASQEITSLLDQKKTISDNIKKADQTNFLYAQNKATEEIKRIDTQIENAKRSMEISKTEKKELKENISTGYNALFVELRNKLSSIGIISSASGVASTIHWVIAALFDISVIVLVNASFPVGFFEKVFDERNDVRYVQERTPENKPKDDIILGKLGKRHHNPIRHNDLGKPNIMERYLEKAFELGRQNGKGYILGSRKDIKKALNITDTEAKKIENKLKDFGIFQTHGRGTNKITRLTFQEALDIIMEYTQ